MFPVHSILSSFAPYRYAAVVVALVICVASAYLYGRYSGASRTAAQYEARIATQSKEYSESLRAALAEAQKAVEDAIVKSSEQDRLYHTQISKIKAANDEAKRTIAAQRKALADRVCLDPDSLRAWNAANGNHQ